MTTELGHGTELPLRVTVDNSQGLRQTTARAEGQERTIHLQFEATEDGEFKVRAWGRPAFPDDGAGAYEGILQVTRPEIDLYVEQLRNTWNVEFLGYQGPSEVGTRQWPFSDHVDLTNPSRRTELYEATRKLAASGERLYRILFGKGDRGLREIGQLLTAALRARRHVITIHSDDVFVPWWMLYLSPEPGTLLDAGDQCWRFEGFLGYHHIIEHNFKRTPGWHRDVSASGRIRAGLNIDRRLDTQFATTPPIGPVIDLFRRHASIVVRETRPMLARDISSPSFADQLIYFGCHGFAGDSQTLEAHLRLTDNEPIAASHISSWLMSGLIQTSPVVVINACRGAHMSTALCATFGKELLRHGAKCLLGPQIDVPPAFATAYINEFIPRVLGSGATIGDAVHELAVSFAERFHNPLGLAMSLYRGLDTRFVVGQKGT